MFSSKNTAGSKRLGAMAYAPLILAPAFYFSYKRMEAQQPALAWGAPNKHQEQIDIIKKNKPNYPDNTLL